MSGGVRLLRASAVALPLVAISVSALAQSTLSQRSTQTLYKNCKLGSDSPEGISCLSYLLGVADHMKAIGTLLEKRGSIFGRGKPGLAGFAICQSEFSGASLRQVFINWAEKHPKEWTQDMLLSTMDAFRDTWPCK